ncbi:T6SS immunity protein Tli3 family protein [Leminorella grimontii]|uniref:T6SS immunity protein Tli3 family protein n=1 Tax=Leminorella grimontii TaxID=82981 RepID=UPI0032207717
MEPQVIYRLDDNRYVELSKYTSCESMSGDQWVAEAWYYDLNLGIKTEISPWIRAYKGRIINADPSGKNLVFPLGNSRALYSSDYGRTFSYWVIGNPSEIASSAEDATFAVTDKELVYYQERKGEYSFTKKIFDGKNVDEKSVTNSGSAKAIPVYSASMGGYQCNAEVKPRSVSKIKIKEYDERRRPYFEQLLLSVNKTVSAIDKVGSWLVTRRTHYAVYEVAPQVIYRLDDNRYVELSNYGGCLPSYEDEKVVEVWYHDLSRNIKTRLFSKMRNYRGKVINADLSGKNLAFPVMSDRTTCAEEICGESMVYYSTDYGRTFKPFFYLRYSDGLKNDKREPLDSLKYSQDYLITIITDKELALYRKDGYGYKFEKIALDKVDGNGEPVDSWGREDLILPPHPGLMDSYQCDATIRPKSVDGITVEEYNRQRKGN